MKKVKVTASSPQKGQRQIPELIGREYKVLDYDQETGEVSVHDDGFGGRIILQKSEYQVVE